MLEIINFPLASEWLDLSKRPELLRADLDELVAQVFSEIQTKGDSAVKKYTALFDGFALQELQVPEEEINAAAVAIGADLKLAILLAKTNIERFHLAQLEKPWKIETCEGVECWRESRPIEKIGIYIPGGTAPLFSTVLMLGIPAKIAGCKEIVLCTPPDKDGNINPAILYAASLAGITKIFRVGGIQAIGAMVFGTESVSKVDKIFGPGNQYVAAAKQAAISHGVAIDLPAGPSELLVIADKTADPDFVAADLLSQAEHGTDSQVILLSDDQTLIRRTIEAIEKQLCDLPRKEIAQKALSNSKAILFRNLEECTLFSNLYAPEHLIIASASAIALIPEISNAGSVFLGNYSCESAGDYASGTNHTLPTNGFARNYSGVSVDSFIKKITFQVITETGIRNIGPAIEIMAAAEQLQAHKNAVTIRLNKLKYD